MHMEAYQSEWIEKINFSTVRASKYNLRLLLGDKIARMVFDHGVFAYFVLLGAPFLVAWIGQAFKENTQFPQPMRRVRLNKDLRCPKHWSCLRGPITFEGFQSRSNLVAYGWDFGVWRISSSWRVKKQGPQESIQYQLLLSKTSKVSTQLFVTGWSSLCQSHTRWRLIRCLQ